MWKTAKFLAVATAIACSTAAFCEPPPTAPPSGAALKTPKHVDKIIGKRDGKTCATAYRVRSVREEYKIMASLGLKPFKQALISGKKPCDILTATDPSTGDEYEVWFDISAFYPMF